MPPTFTTPDTQKSSLRYGQQYDPQTGIAKTFTEQDEQVALVTPLLGDPDVEITPTDRYSSLVRTFTIPSADIISFSRTWVEMGDIELPNTLDSITTVFETNFGDGQANETATGGSVGDNPSLSISIPSSAQASAAILPDLQIIITPHNLSGVEVLKVLFYSAQGDSLATILTRLTAICGASVQAWPAFSKSEKIHVFSLLGQQTSISVGAKVSQSVTVGATDTYIVSTGDSDSAQVGNSIKTITTPPTIHGAITITDPTADKDIAATADAEIEAGTGWPAVSKTHTANATVNASVTPTMIAATTPVSAIPSSGLRLYKLSGELSPYAGYATQYAIIFNFANA